MSDGGPAFPQDLQGRRGDDPQYQGMTLRDYFAAHAPESLSDDLVSTVADAASFLGIDVSQYDPLVHYPMVIAKANYQYADAMLAAREETGNDDD